MNKISTIFLNFILKVVILVVIQLGPTTVFCQLQRLGGRIVSSLFREGEESAAMAALRSAERRVTSRLLEENAERLGTKYSRPNSLLRVIPDIHESSSLAIDRIYHPEKVYANPSAYSVKFINSLNAERITTSAAVNIIDVNGELVGFINTQDYTAFKILYYKKLLHVTYETDISLAFRNAISGFQSKNQIPVTGMVDQLTYKKMSDEVCNTYLTSKQIITDVNLSSKSNKINICCFQRKNLLSSTGKINTETKEFILKEYFAANSGISVISHTPPDLYSFNYKDYRTLSRVGISYTSLFRSNDFHSRELRHGPDFGYDYFKFTQGKLSYSFDAKATKTKWFEVANPDTKIIVEELYETGYLSKNRSFYTGDEVISQVYAYKIDHGLPTAQRKNWVADEIEFAEMSNSIAKKNKSVVLTKKLLNELKGTSLELNKTMSGEFKKALSDAVGIQPNKSIKKIKPEWIDKLQTELFTEILSKEKLNFQNFEDFLNTQYGDQTTSIIGYVKEENSEFFMLADNSTNGKIFAFKKVGNSFEIVENLENLIKKYSNSLRELVSKYCSPENSYFYLDPVLSDDKNIIFTFQENHLSIPVGDFLSFQSGEEVSFKTKTAIEKFKKEYLENKNIVFFNDPLSLQLFRNRIKRIALIDESSFVITGPDLYLFAKNQIGSKDVFFARNLEKSFENLANKSVNTSSLELFVPAKDMNVQDYGVNSFLQKVLPKECIRKDIKTPTTAEIVLTLGHKDIKYKGFIEKIRLENQFKDKIWLSYSCYEIEDEIAASKIIINGGAKAVIYFGNSINPYATRAVIIEFNKLSKVTDLTMLEKTELAIKNAIKTYPFLKKELDKIIANFIYQLAFDDRINIVKNKDV